MDTFTPSLDTIIPNRTMSSHLELVTLAPRIKHPLITSLSSRYVPNRIFFGHAGTNKAPTAIAMCKDLGRHCIVTDRNLTVDKWEVLVVENANKKAVLVVPHFESLNKPVQAAILTTIEELTHANDDHSAITNIRFILLTAHNWLATEIAEGTDMVLYDFDTTTEEAELLAKEQVVTREFPTVTVLSCIALALLILTAYIN